MEALVSSALLGVLVFASTNIDDIFILAAFYADPKIARRSIVIGQFLGIGALVLASAAAAILALEFRGHHTDLRNGSEGDC